MSKTISRHATDIEINKNTVVGIHALGGGASGGLDLPGTSLSLPGALLRV